MSPHRFVVALALLLGACGAPPEGTPATASPAEGSPAEGTPAEAPPVAAPVPPPAAPPSFKCCADPGITSVVAEYLGVQKALAGDDDAAAAAALDALASASTAAGKTVSEPQRHEALATIARFAVTARAATDITDRRTEIKELSATVVSLARLDAGGAREVSEAWCPMANGAWIQEGATIANPYYGASMLTCGTFR